MVTIKEIAKECGVSTATVSNIINGKKNVGEDTRARVMAVIERTGYKLNYVAQGLRKKKTQTIGIIAEDIGIFTTPEMIEGVMEVCEDNGYRTIVQNLRLYSRWDDLWFDNEKMYNSVMDPAVQEMASIRVDGIIYIAGHGRKISRFPSGYDIPAVLAYAYSQQSDVPSVVIDDEDSARVMVKYLIDHGHKRIGVLAGEQDNLHAKLRMLGYQRALYEAGILYDPNLVIYAGWGKEYGYRESANMLKNDVTAVFCMSDRIAGGLYQYLYEHNMEAGKDISVVGFDGEIISEFMMPELTTTKIDLIGIGKTAMNMLLDKLDGKETEQLVKVPCKFIERRSVNNI
ncbi:MAG: LacI family DNA-binding transcriptional regulator [Butyrivibrio sp.]|nr:LacI family DNA-binding transcriptional regulator [Butyrivibrio sp.]